MLNLSILKIRHVVRDKWREVWVWEYKRRRIGLERTKLYLANRRKIFSVPAKKDQIRAENFFIILIAGGVECRLGSRIKHGAWIGHEKGIKLENSLECVEYATSQKKEVC